MTNRLTRAQTAKLAGGQPVLFGNRLAALLHCDAYVSNANKLSPGLSAQRKLAAIS